MILELEALKPMLSSLASDVGGTLVDRGVGHIEDKIESGKVDKLHESLVAEIDEKLTEQKTASYSEALFNLVQDYHISEIIVQNCLLLNPETDDEVKKQLKEFVESNCKLDLPDTEIVTGLLLQEYKYAFSKVNELKEQDRRLEAQITKNVKEKIQSAATPIMEKLDGLKQEQIVNNYFTDPSLTIYQEKDDPTALQFTFDNIAHAIQQTSKLPDGYEPKVVLEHGKATIDTEAVSEEANKNPIHYQGKLDIRVELNEKDREKFANDPEGLSKEILRRAYISQTPINVSHAEIKRMIGNEEDPFQQAFQDELKHAGVSIIPKPLPPAEEYILYVEYPDGSKSFESYQLNIRIQPSDPDKHELIMATEQPADGATFKLIFNGETRSTQLKYGFQNTNWNDYLKFFRFLNVAKENCKICFTRSSDNKLFLAFPLQRNLYDGDEKEIQDAIKFAKDIIRIQAEYGVNLPLKYQYQRDDLEWINLLANSIRGQAVKFHWKSFDMTGVVRKDTPISYFNADNLLAVDQNVNLEIAGVQFPPLRVRNKFDKVRIGNIDEIEKVYQHVLETGEPEDTTIKMISGDEDGVGDKIVLTKEEADKLNQQQ